ncbi:hypothetical protein J6590_039160 [Homalodisca vitripennis]|nr:hypothetical protein J6590_039160 [Homalodisca vitripennis]
MGKISVSFYYICLLTDDGRRSVTDDRKVDATPPPGDTGDSRWAAGHSAVVSPGFALLIRRGPSSAEPCTLRPNGRVEHISPADYHMSLRRSWTVDIFTALTIFRYRFRFNSFLLWY